MINKNKTYKTICSLIIVLIIFTPISSFAGTHSVKNWEEYREKVEEDIKKQEETITINFSEELIFTTEYFVRNKVENELRDVINKLPKYLGELNIENIQTAVELKNPENSSLTSVTHKMEYKSSKDNISALSGLLKEKYEDIKFKATDYKKIEVVYNYIKEFIDEDPLKTLLKNEKHGDNATTFLFAMMMSELGYDNDIASGDEPVRKWNLVKVQGLWYHVDIKKGEFLISKDSGTWSDSLATGEKFADEDYDEAKQEELQLAYEIKLLEKLLEKAGETKLETDIIVAKEKIDLFKVLDDEGKYIEEVEQLEQRIDALEKLIELEVSITSYVDDFSNENKTEIDRTIGNFNEAIKDHFPENIKEKYNTRLALARNTREAIGKIIEIENTKLEDQNDKIASAKYAIEKISDLAIREKLSSKLDIVEAYSLINGQISSAKEKVESVDTDTDTASIEGLINEAKDLIGQAKLGLKDIKDTDYKKQKGIEIKEVESLIGVLNAVLKAETPPLKMTNVTSARKSIDKLDDNEYEAIMIELNKRLDNAEDEIDISSLLSNAIKAVEKAEKSMKDADIASAEKIVKEIKDKAETGNLELRLAAILSINNMESSLANYLADHSQENRNSLSSTISKVNNSIQAIESLGIDSIVEKYSNRLDLARKTRTAIDNIIKAIDETSINTAKESIAEISDSKIKKELEKELDIILDQRDIEEKIKKISQAIEVAKNSVKLDDDLNNNIEAVKACEAILKSLPSGKDKTAFGETIKELNNVINAKKIVKGMEDKLDQASLSFKDILTAEKVVENLEKEYREAKPEVEPKQSLEERVENLRAGLENLGLTKARLEVENAEKSAKYDIKALSKNISTAKKAVEQISNNKEEDKTKLNDRIIALESYVSTIKVLEVAEKTKNSKNLNATETALDDFEKLVNNEVPEEDRGIYNDLKEGIESRIDLIKNYLTGANEKQEAALTKVEQAEAEMTVTTDPEDTLIQDAQDLVDLVIDNAGRAKIQERIDAIKLAKEAKLAVSKAESYLVEKSVKDAETILDKVDGKYSSIIKNLSSRISKLRNQLELSKKVLEATKLVEKATKSRTLPDLSAAKFAIEGIKAAEETYDTLKKILDELDESIRNEAGDQVAALKAAKDALYGEKDLEDGEIGLFSRISQINLAIVNIIADKEDEEESIQEVYVMIEGARLQIIKAEAAVRRLNDKKNLLLEIDGGKAELDLSEDKLHVKEAVRLISIASSSVNKAKNDLNKPKAVLDIAAARRAIDKIKHSDNKAIKTTLLNTLKAIESKLISDNDQELIDIAIEAVNNAADVFSKALNEERVIADGEKIDKAIFSAKISITGISDNNKSVKESLTRFINDIETMYKDEKAGVANEDYIRKAKAAVVVAEASKLEGDIRSARLRVQMIRPVNPEAELKINDLIFRLDLLEGKVDKTPDPSKPDTTKPGTTKPGATKPSGETSIIKIPTNPLPYKDRDTDVSQPKWGETKELKKKSPIIKFPYY